HHHFSALLRGGRDLRRLCHGPDVDAAGAGHVQAARHHHAAAHRQNGQDHFVDRLLRHLCLHDGIFHGLVQRQCLRALRLLEPRGRSLLVVLVGGHVVLQDVLAATVLVPLVSAKYFRRLFRLAVRVRRHVLRAFHHYRRRVALGLSAVFLGLVLCS